MTKKITQFLSELKRECKTDYDKIIDLFEKHNIAIICYDSMKDVIKKVKKHKR